MFGYDSQINGVNEYITNCFSNMDLKDSMVDFLVIDRLDDFYKNRLDEKKYHAIYQVPMFRKNMVTSLKQIKNFYKMHQYDVIYLNISCLPMYVYVFWAKRYNKNVKLIVHSHLANIGNYAFKFFHYMCKLFIFRKTDKFFACSLDAGKFMYNEKIVNSNDFELIHNGINLEKFQFNLETREKIREKYHLNQQFVIGHIGRFSSEKNHLFIIDILKNLKEKNIKLLLIGNGPEKQKIESMVNENNLKEKVIFIEKCDNVNEMYQAMDIFILPSLYEGLPIVGIEAQASGLKCLISNNVSKELEISDLVEFLPLEGVEWIKKIENVYQGKDYQRKNMADVIRNSGYDIKTEAKKVENILLKI